MMIKLIFFLDASDSICYEMNECSFILDFNLIYNMKGEHR